jgi:glucose 1-dehydrogenase
MPDSEVGELLPADLVGRRAVVTGAARGIGAEIADHLLRAGARVVAVDRDKEHLAGRFSERDGCSLVAADLYQEGGKEVAERVLRENGPVELIVNNAGISTEHGFFNLTEEHYDQVFGTNARAPFFFTKRLVEELVEGAGADRRPTHGRGAVLFISSVHDTTPAMHPHYSASKAAVRMFTCELARDLGRHGIRVNAISPGWIRTNGDPTSSMQRTKAQALVPRIPLGRPGEAREVARLAIFLLSEACAGYITGSTVRIDGGLSLDTWAGDEQS